MHMQVDPDDSCDAAGTRIAWARVAGFASAVDSHLDRWLADTYRVGLTEFRALDLLSRAPENELRVNDLAQRVGLDPSSATRMVTRLAAKGFARRDVCEADGRGVYAVLEHKGADLLRVVRAPYTERVEKLLGDASAHFPQLDARYTAEALAAVASIVEP